MKDGFPTAYYIAKELLNDNGVLMQFFLHDCAFQSRYICPKVTSGCTNGCSFIQLSLVFPYSFHSPILWFIENPLHSFLCNRFKSFAFGTGNISKVFSVANLVSLTDSHKRPMCGSEHAINLSFWVIVIQNTIHIDAVTRVPYPLHLFMRISAMNLKISHLCILRKIF